MTAAPRLDVLLSLWLLLSLILNEALATPHSLHAANVYARKVDPVISYSPNGSVSVLDPTTEEPIPQGPGTDGSGSNFSLPAVIWLVFLLVIGAPLAVAGIRGWRCTTGVAIGLVAIVCSWAAIINSVNQEGISDILIVIVVLAFGFLGLILGIFEFARRASMAALCIMGGLAFGLRIVLIKKDLLTSSMALNWVIAAIFGLAGGLLIIWKLEVAMLVGCASTGTFLASLGIDLMLNRQSGLSFGLRSLFDNNDNHIAYFLESKYDPTLSTRIVIIISLGLTPILAFVQHRLFKEPFTRRGPPPSDEDLCLNFPTEDLSARRGTAFLSGLWDSTMKMSANRFSL